MPEKVEIENRNGIEVAIIGMAGRFPGAKNTTEFWENLINGVESISFLSDEEISESKESQRMKLNPNYVNSNGGVLENIEYFDAYFFGYTPPEAEIMDPQIRIFLECSWEVLENAGYTPVNYRGLIGLYAGASDHFNWKGLSMISSKRTEIGDFAAKLLSDREFLATTVSYKLNLIGPAVFVQTACSTSLVAIHMACQALLNGECDMALVGGISIDSSKNVGYIYQEGMLNSPDGRCRAFDSKASGLTSGNGVGIVMLKLLDDALEDRDHIFAVIKGSAINNDGNRKSSYTAPSVAGQSEAIISAHRVSEVPSVSISYVETHGTGTKLGDTIEIEALKKGFNTNKKQFCAIGSVKPNVGHLGAAAGVTGFIKTVLALMHRLLPPSLNFDTPNPEIDFENSPFFVNKRLREWKSNEYPLRAGVSSFGIGGTNAHVVLEEAPVREDSSEGRAFQLLLLSAKTKSALKVISKNLTEYLRNNPGINLSDMSFTLNAGRSVYNYRRMVLCSNINEMIHTLSTPKLEEVHTLELNGENIPIVFVFSGLGSQYVNMGLDLYKTEAIFRNEIERCFKILKPLMGYDIKNILYPSIAGNIKEIKEQTPIDKAKLSPGRPDLFEVGQVIVFTVEYALARLLIEWGIKPQAMIGYSFGEISAACLAGVFSLEDALKMIVCRGKLIKTVPEGAMLSVPLPLEEVKSLICDGVSIAIDNGQSCVVSGSIPSLAAFEEKMKKKGQICMRLKASVAIHSEMMEPILNEFEDRVKEVKLNKPQIPYISNVTGTWINDKDALNPAYWKKHLRGTVRFSDGTNELIKMENVIFVEIGPGRDISALLARYLENYPGRHVLNLIRPSTQDVSDIYYLLNKIGILWLWGVKIEWPKFYSQEKRYRIPLPTYPFEGERYWLEGDLSELGTGIIMKQSQSNLSADMSDWFFLPSWKRLPRYPVLQKKEKNSVKYNWLVFINDLNPGKFIMNKLEQEGHTIVVVKTGDVFTRIEERIYTINPRESSNYDNLLNELQRSEKFPDKILHCWGLTGENINRSATKSFEDILNIGFYSLLYIVKAIGKHNLSNSIDITVLTDNLHEIIGGELLSPAKSMILGLINSIPQEYPGIRCSSIDILLPQPGTSEEETLIDILWEELTSGSHEPVVAIRNNNRWTRIFESLRLGPELKEYTKLRKNGVYLITGGLGNIGLMLSELLARRAGAKLVLIGRSKFPPKDEFITKKLRQIEALGGQVLYIQADASNLEQMRETILCAEQTFGAINGVFHCAGITGGRSMRAIQDLSPDDCSLQYQSKAHGAKILEELFKNKEPDFVWILSSISSFLGGLGFAAYSAANIFLDTLVRCHNRLEKKQRHWFSLNWDGLEAEKSIEIFERLLSLENLEQIIFSVGGNLKERFDRWIKLVQVKNDVHVLSEEEKESRGRPRPYLSSRYVPPRTFEEEKIRAVWERILGIDGIGVKDDFLELGGDSLKAITAISRIQQELKANIPVSEFFTQPTVEGIAHYISAQARHNTFVSMEPTEKKEYYVLSPAQKRLYIINQLDEYNLSYNISKVVVLEGELRWQEINETFRMLVQRHESLRTSFDILEQKPIQRVHDEVEFCIEYNHLTTDEENCKLQPTYYKEFPDFKSQVPDKITQKERVDHHLSSLIHQFIRSFNLARAPLLRVGLIKIHEEKHILMLDMHHIISDGVSLDILVKDNMTLFSKKVLPPLKIQYKDFSEWLNKEQQQKEKRKQEEYWLKMFKNNIPELHLPMDYDRPAVQGGEGDTVSFEIDEKKTGQLKKMAVDQDVTVFMVLIAIYTVFLSRLTGQEDITIGTGTAGRGQSELMQIIGMFVNTLALRNFPAKGKSFSTFLIEVRENTLLAFKNQDYPFEELVRKVLPERNWNQNPLFDTVIVSNNVVVEAGNLHELGSPKLKIKPYPFQRTFSSFDIGLLYLETGNKLQLAFEYNIKLFRKETIEKFVSFFKDILSTVTENHGIKLEDITISHRLLRANAKKSAMELNI